MKIISYFNFPKISIIILATFVIGCAGTRTNLNYQRNYDYSKLKSIAILPFIENYRDTMTGEPPYERLDYEASDAISMQLFDADIKIVDRMFLETVLKEQALTLTGIMEQGDYIKIGKIAHVDAILWGNISLLKAFMRKVTVTTRLIDVETGTVIFTSQGETKDGWGGTAFGPEPLKNQAIQDAGKKLQTFLQNR